MALKRKRPPLENENEHMLKRQQFFLTTVSSSNPTKLGQVRPNTIQNRFIINRSIKTENLHPNLTQLLLNKSNSIEENSNNNENK